MNNNPDSIASSMDAEKDIVTKVRPMPPVDQIEHQHVVVFDRHRYKHARHDRKTQRPMYLETRMVNSSSAIAVTRHLIDKWRGGTTISIRKIMNAVHKITHTNENQMIQRRTDEVCGMLIKLRIPFEE